MGATAVGPRNQGGGRLLKRKLCRQQLPPAPQYIPGTRYMLKIPKYLLGSHLLHIWHLFQGHHHRLSHTRWETPEGNDRQSPGTQNTVGMSEGKGPPQLSLGLHPQVHELFSQNASNQDLPACRPWALPPMRKSSPATYCIRPRSQQQPSTPTIQPKRMMATAMPMKPAVILRRSAGKQAGTS